MLNDLISLISRLFRRENLVALLLIAAAIISVFGIPQHFGISELTVVVILVGFLALDSLIEKVGYLEEIESRVRGLEASVLAHPNMILLQRREALRSFPERVKGVRNIYILSLSANTLVMQNSDVIRNALETGTNFRFLLMSPKSAAIHAAELSSPTSANTDTQIRWIEDTIEMLRQVTQKRTKGRIEVHLFDCLPTASIVGYDIDRDDGWLQVELHTYRKTPSSRPLFVLQANSRSEWYEFYCKVIEELWKESLEISL
ncbi:MAG: hypothetical protein KJ077_28830 [Anaerolineae bacterium]|nr:hypothetical protein [Anaerolineae bacterium]